MGELFGGFFVRIFCEEFFGMTYLVDINKEFLSRFWGNFVSKQKEGRRTNLEVQCKLIALKKYFEIAVF